MPPDFDGIFYACGIYLIFNVVEAAQMKTQRQFDNFLVTVEFMVRLNNCTS
jgi:hypothetical protein